MIATVHVANDFDVLGWSLPGFVPADLVQIGRVPQPTEGTMAVMEPGTGFGLSALASNGGAEVVVVTEAGHATLSTENRREDAIILALGKRLQHISIERVLSVPGLIQLYLVIARIDGVTVPQRSSAEIVGHALAGDCEVSHAALEALSASWGVWLVMLPSCAFRPRSSYIRSRLSSGWHGWHASAPDCLTLRQSAAPHEIHCVCELSAL